MAKEKFLLLSLKEEKAKKVAQVISNPSCRKILDHLAEKESTETELAKKLDLPISTVHYNLQQLVHSNLVAVEEFHYSEKGKEVNHYKLANKYVIIAPKSTFGIKEKLKSILPVVGLTVITAGFLQLFSKGLPKGGTNTLTTITKTLGGESFKAAQPVVERAAAIPVMDKASEQAMEAVSTPAMDSAAEGIMGNALVESTVESTAEQVIEATTPVMDSAPIESAVEGVIEQAMDEAVTEAPIAAQKVVEDIATSTVTTPLPASPLVNIALWFFLGAIFSIVLYLIISKIREK